MRLNQLDEGDLAQIEKRLDRLDRVKGRPSRKRHGCLKFLGCLILAIIIVLVIGWAIIKFAVGPVVKQADALPADFPKELILYQPEAAKIILPTKNAQASIINLLRGLPDWLAKPILNYFSDKIKTQVNQNFGNQMNIARDFSAADLKKALENIDLQKVKNVSLSWDAINKTKEELAAYYKQMLGEANFEYKENLADYEIDLGFWKDGIFGTMSFSDEKGGAQSDAEVKVNYIK